MSKTYEFLVQCDFFVVTTVNENAPAARPFGAVMEYNEELYISTANTKKVYSQLKENPRIQIIAKKDEARDWIRIDGNAIEVFDLDIKQAMLDHCPGLLKHFPAKESENFALFKISEMKSQLHASQGATLLT